LFITRIELIGLAVFSDRAVQVTLVSERDAQVVVDFRVVRLQANGLAVFSDRAVQVTLVVECTPRSKWALASSGFDCGQEQAAAAKRKARTTSFSFMASLRVLPAAGVRLPLPP